MAKLVLRGLDGAKLLGFLAALGTARSLPGSKLSWVLQDCWLPVLEGDFSQDPQEFAESLAQRLINLEWLPPLADHDDSNKISQASFRDAAQHAVSISHSQGSREWSDWVAAIGCDGIVTDGLVADTAFRTMSGAGHQHFLKSFRDLKLITNSTNIHHALFENWSYQDGKPGLRFDDAEDRRYALRWSEPSGDPIRTVRGANRLAAEAMPMFPSMPVKTRLETTGFRGRGSKDTWFAWPLWTTPLGLDAVKSLLTHPYLHDKDRRGDLAAIGVAEVYRSQRLTLGKMRNFTPAVPLGDAP